MATDNTGYPFLTMLAAGDLSAHAGKIMTKNAVADQIALSGGQDEVIAGVLQNKPAAAGRAATVQVAGIAKVKAGGTVAAGDVVAPNATGLAIKFTPTAASVEWILGICMVGGANGEVIEVLILIQTVSTET